MRRVLLFVVLLSVPATARADGLPGTTAYPEVTRDVPLYGCYTNSRFPGPLCTEARIHITAAFDPERGTWVGSEFVQFYEPRLTVPLPGVGLTTFDISPDCQRIVTSEGPTGSCIGRYERPFDPYQYEYVGASPRIWSMTPELHGTDSELGMGIWGGTFATTPEPASLVLMGTGLLVLAGFIRHLR